MIDAPCAICAGPTRVWATPHGKWTYVRCLACGHVALPSQPTEAELTEYYSRSYEYSDAALASSIERRYLGLVARHTSHLGGDDRRAFEHGCNTGLLLAAMRQAGWQVAGTELGSGFREAARAKGLDIRAGLADWAGETFGLMIAFHVIEHVRSPAAELAQLFRMLRPGGVLLLKTPNAASLPARLFPAEWQWSTPPAHLHLFSPTSLARAVADAGFVDVQVSSERGNAKPMLFEVARAGVHHLLGSRHGGEPGVDRPQVRSNAWWYRMALSPAEAIATIGTPVASVLGRQGLMPELTLVARAPA